MVMKYDRIKLIVAFSFLSASITSAAASDAVAYTEPDNGTEHEVSADIPVASASVQHAPVSVLWDNAISAYSEGNFDLALECFGAIEMQGFASARLYYNIGNCYFKKGHFSGKAILYYERALKEDPSFGDAAYNLDIARQYTVDKIESVPEFILLTWIKAFRNIMTTNAWAWVFLAMTVLTAVLILLFRFAASLPVRKTAFSLAILTLLFAIIAFIFSLNLRNEAEKGGDAVIVTPVCSVKSSPGAFDQSLFILHEGTKVEVLDVLGDWYRIELSDGRQGWTEKKNMEII